MGTVIGYKGTTAERRLAWNTMIQLRKTIAWSRQQIAANDNYRPTLDKEQEWYRDEFKNYLAA